MSYLSQIICRIQDDIPLSNAGVSTDSRLINNVCSIHYFEQFIYSQKLINKGKRDSLLVRPPGAPDAMGVVIHGLG